MDYQKNEKKRYVTDYFYLTKSYDEILADHVLIKKMKLTLEQAGMSQYAERCSFEELIKEAYFQCGIILRRLICYSYLDYYELFIERERRLFGKYDETNKRTVACMVHLLLSTRKKNPDGVGEIVDRIKKICDLRDYSFLPPNPFERLLFSGKYRHEIDFGVRAKPFYYLVWDKINWYELGLEDDCYEFDIENGNHTPDDYCEHLTEKINDVMACLDFEEINDQLEALDKIGKWLHSEGCYVDDCEFYKERPYKCAGCDESFRDKEAKIYNPLKRKVIESIKQSKTDKPTKKKKNDLSIENKVDSDIYLSGTVNKTDMGRIIYSLCKMNAFKDKDGKPVEIKKVFETFGEFLHENYSKPNNYIKTDIKLSEHLDIFNKMNNAFQDDYNDKLESKKKNR